MDLPQSEDEHEIDTQLLIDSGTESITESPVNEETESEQSEDLTVCDIRTEASKTKETRFQQHLLDKSFSIDEEILATPLQPTQILPIPHLSPTISNPNEDKFHISLNVDSDDGIVEGDFIAFEDAKYSTDAIDFLATGDMGQKDLIQFIEGAENYVDDKGISSILRRTSCFETDNELLSPGNYVRRVSFPSDEKVLVSYREPDNTFQWMINKDMPHEKILQVYQNSCKKHQTIELDIIRDQIQDIKNNTNHSATLNLSCVNITSEVNETLEDLFKVTNFHKLVLHECRFTPETISEFLNILEYYESVCHLEVSTNFEDDDTWKCYCSAVSNIMVLESLSFIGMTINDQYMRNLLHAIKSNTNITTLKFDGCMLVKLPNFYLIDCLISNTTIRELYLPSTGLYTKEADILGRFLQKNAHLKVLDISNNFIGDRGLEVLAKGLTNQITNGQSGMGLSVLIIFNNQLTEKSGPIIGNIMTGCKNLHTLNIGFNGLKDDVLKHIRDSLILNSTLEGLGLQCTLLTCAGMDYLAEAIPKNKSLQKINLRGNKAIQINGVEKLCEALTKSRIRKIEIDETNRSCSDPERYMEGVVKLHAICTVNKSFNENTDEEITNISQRISRKVSLSCEPKYFAPDPTTTFQVGSPVSLSPMCSPGTRSRFSISKVSETCTTTTIVSSSASSTRSKSRFRVTKVVPSPDEDISYVRFANVRSSVSSNDSVDSLTTLHLDSDSD